MKNQIATWRNEASLVEPLEALASADQQRSSSTTSLNLNFMMKIP
jgi:hypothetical protein